MPTIAEKPISKSPRLIKKKKIKKSMPPIAEKPIRKSPRLIKKKTIKKSMQKIVEKTIRKSPRLIKKKAINYSLTNNKKRKISDIAKKETHNENKSISKKKKTQQNKYITNNDKEIQVIQGCRKEETWLTKNLKKSTKCLGIIVLQSNTNFILDIRPIRNVESPIYVLKYIINTLKKYKIYTRYILVLGYDMYCNIVKSGLKLDIQSMTAYEIHILNIILTRGYVEKFHVITHKSPYCILPSQDDIKKGCFNVKHNRYKDVKMYKTDSSNTEKLFIKTNRYSFTSKYKFTKFHAFWILLQSYINKYASFNHLYTFHKQFLILILNKIINRHKYNKLINDGYSFININTLQPVNICSFDRQTEIKKYQLLNMNTIPNKKVTSINSITF